MIAEENDDMYVRTYVRTYQQLLAIINNYIHETYGVTYQHLSAVRTYVRNKTFFQPMAKSQN